jgi:hypothetical protein
LKYENVNNFLPFRIIRKATAAEDIKYVLNLSELMMMEKLLVFYS